MDGLTSLEREPRRSPRQSSPRRLVQSTAAVQSAPFTHPLLFSPHLLEIEQAARSLAPPGPLLSELRDPHCIKQDELPPPVPFEPKRPCPVFPNRVALVFRSPSHFPSQFAFRAINAFIAALITSLSLPSASAKT
jgi:hypothetical protein